VQKAIKAIKYRYAYTVIDDLLLYPSFPTLPKQSLLVPIPLHSSRQKLRGFNQAEIIARVVSKRVDIPVRTDILKRIRKTVPQVDTKSREERLSNMIGAFVVDKKILLSARQNDIVLVDDVYTTGATMQAACEAIKRAGAKVVWGLTIAQ
jgi:ComF family protein